MMDSNRLPLSLKEGVALCFWQLAQFLKKSSLRYFSRPFQTDFKTKLPFSKFFYGDRS